MELESGTWTAPANRMKGKRDHRVPLSARALQIQHEARKLSGRTGLVFPSAHGHALSDNTISKLLWDLGIPAVPHGFRSSLRDCAAECSEAPREVCELAPQVYWEKILGIIYQSPNLLLTHDRDSVTVESQLGRRSWHTRHRARAIARASASSN